MQIDPVASGVSIEPIPIEPKQKVPAEHVAAPDSVVSAPGKTPVQTEVQHPAALPPPERVTVSVDSSQIVVYRFLDGKTGEVLSQTPAEEVLRVVRGIQELAQEQQRRESTNVNVRG